MAVLVKYFCVAALYVSMGNRLAYSSEKHTLSLRPGIRKFLLIADAPSRRVSIAGVIWQILFYLTACSFLAAYGILKVETAWLLGLFDFIMTIEWIGIGLPLILYSVIGNRT